ncbi:hypothetical protein K505DRAFT_366459 [Melanomma pulvis-pyrius CBS 109.77]|uniref:Uncharacterized protein n=1 Tax=Melanomma pulvis-pyrius CBS 109.77 TaxID=1314802 RepID=A0A6A6WX14_9PLEO|nr:hypothetical protein K505DRAFT_366459 [Melanomma pulvis-pyrius CBS 109.77]
MLLWNSDSANQKVIKIEKKDTVERLQNDPQQFYQHVHCQGQPTIAIISVNGVVNWTDVQRGYIEGQPVDTLVILDSYYSGLAIPQYQTTGAQHISDLINAAGPNEGTPAGLYAFSRILRKAFLGLKGQAFCISNGAGPLWTRFQQTKNLRHQEVE